MSGHSRHARTAFVAYPDLPGGVVTEEALNNLADAWVRHWHAPKHSEEQSQTFWAIEEEHDLFFDGKSEELWQLILKIHERDHSIAIQQVLCRSN
jgi:hypothetical protein